VFEEIQASPPNQKSTSSLFDKEHVHDILNNLDTEWDKRVFRAWLTANRSRKEIAELGIDVDHVAEKSETVLQAINQKKEAMLDAVKIVETALAEQLKKLNEEIASKEKHLEGKKNLWTKDQLEDLREEISCLTDRQKDITSLIRKESNESRKNVKLRVRRVQSKLIEKRRIGRRRRGAGRRLSMDKIDENFLVQCIDNKATAHGRRHDSVMYLNHRVKKKDFIKIVNFSRDERKLPRIRSASTVYNRGLPKNKRSRQAKNHIGAGMFCCKKPPKAEDEGNELVHHQRAHKKNIVLYKCKESSAKYVFQISQDDRAYLCPGTGTNMNSARNQRIYQNANESLARKLPKYDFPVSMVNVTPGTHRVMSKEVININGKEEIRLINDTTFVFARSKHFVGSSGTVWASEFMSIRNEEPQLFEADEPQDYQTKRFRALMYNLKDNVLLYSDATDMKDVENVTSGSSCKFRNYEQIRLQSLQ
jgi:hypothetical protein